jgi:hypothetical protein
VQNLFLVDAHIGEGSFWICLQDKQEEFTHDCAYLYHISVTEIKKNLLMFANI